MVNRFPPDWATFAAEQAELISEYLRRESRPDPDFVFRHALTLVQAAELGRGERDPMISKAQAM
jgi:hypothetical protein